MARPPGHSCTLVSPQLRLPNDFDLVDAMTWDEPTRTIAQHDVGFRLQVPASWKVTLPRGSAYEVVRASKPRPLFSMLFGPSPSMTLSRVTIEGAPLQQLVDQTSQVASERRATDLAHRPVRIAGREAVRMDGRMPGRLWVLRTLRWYFIPRDLDAFVLVLSTANPDSDELVLDQIAQSFTILSERPPAAQSLKLVERRELGLSIMVPAAWAEVDTLEGEIVRVQDGETGAFVVAGTRDANDMPLDVIAARSVALIEQNGGLRVSCARTMVSNVSAARIDFFVSTGSTQSARTEFLVPFGGDVLVLALGTPNPMRDASILDAVAASLRLPK